MADEKLLELLKKLKALADRGEGGERENAAHMLKRLMEKHDVPMDAICDDQLKEREFFVSDDHNVLFGQVISSVIGERASRYQKLTRDTRKLKSRFYNLTDAEYIEVQAKWEFYLRAWKEERKRQLDLILKAFIHKNELYSTEGNTTKKSDLTPEQLQEYMNILSLMEGMKRHHFAKQIDNK